MTVNQKAISLSCELMGLGAWGPGFNDWETLKHILLSDNAEADLSKTDTPKPEIIPANERRRAPLAVRAAVDVSWQALQQSGLDSSSVACVFGSGLGDTEITDYMCRVLTTSEKQLSPTKFHNSVHNAAAGYWTISTNSMKSANSIAAYQMTAGLALLEGFTQCVLQNEPVLITLFDIAPHDIYRQIFSGEHSFAAALLIKPISDGPSLGRMCLTESAQTNEPQWVNQTFQNLYRDNPAAKVLDLLRIIVRSQAGQSANSSTLQISPMRSIDLRIESTLKDLNA